MLERCDALAAMTEHEKDSSSSDPHSATHTLLEPEWSRRSVEKFAEERLDSTSCLPKPGVAASKWSRRFLQDK